MNSFSTLEGVEVLCFLPSTLYPLNDFDLRAFLMSSLIRGVPRRLNNGVLSAIQKQTPKRLKSGFKIIS